MQTNRVIPAFLLILIFTSPCLGQWAESFYDCICFSGTRNECLKKVDQEYPEFRSEFSKANSTPDSSTAWLSQMRAAQIILDQRYQVRGLEEGSCLQSAIGVIKSAISFSIREKQLSPNHSQPFLKSLYNLSKDAYQWAQSNCFDQSNGPNAPLNINLPNPQFCRTHQ